LYREFPVDYPSVGAIGVALLVLAVIGVIVASRIGGSIKQTGSITGKAFRPRREMLGRTRPVWGTVVILYFVVAVVLPLAVLLYASLLRNYQLPSLQAFASMGLDNYRDVFANPNIVTAFGNTVLLGMGAATIAMIITVVAAWITVRTKIKGRALLDALAFSPIVIPGLVFGVALAFVYLRLPIPVYGTLLILLIAYVTRFMPYGMRYAVAAMSSISPELEESAQVSGASWWTRMRRVILPLAAPGVISGWLFILIVTFRELQSSILIYTPGQEVVSILIFQEFQDGRLSLVAAIGILLVALLIVIVTIAQIVGARRGIRVE
jgi:iron(III) transport system permease protein